MAPKQKAKDLFNFFMNCDNMIFLTEGAKECALKIVDEIIQLHCGGCMECGGLDIEYWQEVKQEIKNIKL